MNHNYINTAWQVFTNKLKQTVESCIPLGKRRKIQNSKPKCWHSEIRNSLLAKKRAYQKYKTTKDINDKLEHDRIRHIIKRLIKQSKQNIKLHVANSCKLNPKGFYSYIRKKESTHSTIGPLSTANGEHTEDEFVMANVLNEYFASVFTHENNSSNLPTPRMYNSNTCVFHEKIY